MSLIPTGTAALARIPATSANLGPGFDSLGLALDIYDEYRATVTDSRCTEVRMTGEASADLPTDERHLVAQALHHGLRRWGGEIGGLHLSCTNRIPQGRGLGSSSAAIVGGLLLAQALLGLDDAADVLVTANELEGHPDNVAPAVLGGLTVAWVESGAARAARLELCPDICLTVFIPTFTSPTAAARAALPETVPHGDAAFNAARSALLVVALTKRPDVLLAATQDRLHQEQRRSTYPDAMALVDRLRDLGIPAVISGAGPAVLALAPQAAQASVAACGTEAFLATSVDVGRAGRATRE